MALATCSGHSLTAKPYARSVGVHMQAAKCDFSEHVGLSSGAKLMRVPCPHSHSSQVWH